MLEGLTLRYEFDEVNQQMQDLIDRIEDREAVHAIIGEVLLDRTIEGFENEESPDGTKWKKLHAITLLLKKSKSGKLRETGELFRSIHKETSAAKAEVGTNLNHPKVWAHQFGAEILPIRGPHLIIPGNGVAGPFFLKKATIPARPYIGIGPDDEQRIIEALTDYLEG